MSRRAVAHLPIGCVIRAVVTESKSLTRASGDREMAGAGDTTRRETVQRIAAACASLRVSAFSEIVDSRPGGARGERPSCI
jgi:hypothetical protein